ncbi:MAG: CapA family protein [Bacteroidota bacterium]
MFTSIHSSFFVGISFVIWLVGCSSAAWGQRSQIKLLFAGDIMQHKPQIESAAVVPNQIYDYTSCFQYVAPLLQSADLAIGNLELTLAAQPPYTGFPLFKSPDTLAHALRAAGFDILTTANNHANDGHIAGLRHTITQLEHAQLLQTGTFREVAERALHYPLIVYKNNFKLAFLNYTYSTNGIPTREPTVVNRIDESLIKSDIVTARKLHADIIILCMHWGDEYQSQPNSEQQRLAENMLRWGADLVVGTHPHVVQPTISYTLLRPDQHKEQALVAYSLGNFISNQRRKNADGGMLLEVTFEKDEQTGQKYVQQARYHPVWTYIRQEGQAYRYYVLPIYAATSKKLPTGFLTARAARRMEDYARYLDKLLNENFTAWK